VGGGRCSDFDWSLVVCVVNSDSGLGGFLQILTGPQPLNAPYGNNITIQHIKADIYQNIIYFVQHLKH